MQGLGPGRFDVASEGLVPEMRLGVDFSAAATVCATKRKAMGLAVSEP